MARVSGVVVSVSAPSTAKSLIGLRCRVQELAKGLFKEIDEISGRKLPELGICPPEKE